MKKIIAVVMMMFAASVFAADPFGTVVPIAVKPEAKTEVNCVTKDKKGNCPPAPKSVKPTPKKKADAPAAKASEPAKK
jgi:hypothetical protein